MTLLTFAGTLTFVTSLTVYSYIVYVDVQITSAITNSLCIPSNF